MFSKILNRKKKEEVKPKLTVADLTDEQREQLKRYEGAISEVVENVHIYEEPTYFQLQGVERKALYAMNIKELLYPITMDKIVELANHYEDFKDNGLLEIVHHDKRLVLSLDENEINDFVYDLDLHKAISIKLIFLKELKGETAISTDFRKKD